MKVFGNVDKEGAGRKKRKRMTSEERRDTLLYRERDKGHVLANFFSTELQKALTEKMANTNLSTSDRKKDFIDSSTQKDVETRASCSGQNEGIAVF